MKKIILTPIIALLLFLGLSFNLTAQDLMITGIGDGPLTGGTPKVIELYVINDIADLSEYGISVAANGAASSGSPSITLPTGTATAGDYYYLSGAEQTFIDFFGFAPDLVSGSVSFNGDDAIELYQNGSVVDVFGEVGVVGTGTAWEYLDGWGYRVDNASPTATFDANDWTFSGINQLENGVTNAECDSPMPIGTFSMGGGGLALPFYETYETWPLANWTIVGTHANVWQSNAGTTYGPGSAFEGSLTAMFNVYSTNTGNTTTMTSAEIDMDGAVNPTLKFQYWMNGASDVNLSIKAEMSTDGTNWTQVFYQEQDGTISNWTEALVVLTGVNATTQIRIIGSSDWGSYNLFVDDLSIKEVTCPTPSALVANNLTSSSADLTWTENGTATAWNLKVTTAASFDPTTGTGDIFDGAATGNTHSLTGLGANTTYYFYVQTDCGSGDLSDWSAEGEFSTPCEPISTLPFFEGFESGYTDQNAIDGCWTQESITGTQVWTANSSLTTYNRTPRTGSFNAYLRYLTTDWMYYAFDLTAGTTYRVNIYARQDATTGANITVSYGDNAEATSMTNAIIPETAVTNGNYQLLSGDFTPAADGTYYIGILGELNSSPWYLSIDDFEVLEAPATTITWCNLQHPGTHTMYANETVDIYARAYEDGVTNADANAAGTGVECWIGYSETNTDPSTWANWIPATYNLDVGNNDEFVATLETLTPGTYYYASRWRLDGGLYSYGGFDGGFWDGTTNVSGVLTVNTAIGTDCSNPFVVDIPTALPYEDLSQTNCGLVDVYDNTNISNNYYDNGEDAIYELNVVADTYVRISLDPKTTSYSSISLFDGCPDTGALIDDDLNSGSNVRTIEVGLTAGTYYLMVDTWSTPDCITEYDLTIEAMCPAPTTIETINLTSTSTDLQWTAGGFETSWNIKVNEATAIADPSTTDGDIIGNNPVSPTPEYSIVSGLTAETDYYVYIQADCGSDWVEFMFTTLPTCPTPTDLTASNITVTSADLTWTENGIATAWNLKVTTAATFDPTTGTGEIFDGAATGNTHPLSGLDANTTYYWYVQTDCTGGDLSEWSAVGEFTTQCDIIALPFFEGFENNSTTLNCWTALDLDADGYTWALYTTDSYEGNQSIVSRWNSSGNNDWLISPQLAVNADNYVLDFFAKSTSSYSLEDFEVLVSTTGNNPTDFTIMLESITSHPNAWMQHIYKLSDHGINSGDNIYIAIRHNSIDELRLLVDAFQVRALSSETDFITYSFPEQTGAANIDYNNFTIEIEVGNGTDVTGLVANFEASEGATADIAGTTQESGVTVNDFTTSVTYTVTAEDGTTTQDWLVTVTEAAINTETDIVTYTFPEASSVAVIDNTEKTVDINIAWNADITVLTAEFELSYGANAAISGTPQVSGTTENDFTNPVVYTITAEDGTTTTDWTINVNVDDAPLGANCENPFTVSLPANLPYSDADQTNCGLGDIYSDTEMG
ncbi:MAG: choice-of-anchor J domain-containing protein, partial [Bacteroidales bacterium]|nr:choice-of-anchor J domain-containing protein [Bacteroidales bacterium]